MDPVNLPLRDRVAALLTSAALRLESPAVRVRLDAQEYASRARARERRLGLPPAPAKDTGENFWPRAVALAGLLQGVIDGRVFEQDRIWIDQHGYVRLLEDMTYVHLRNTREFLHATAETWYHRPPYDHSEDVECLWAELGVNADVRAQTDECDYDTPESAGGWACEPAARWIASRPLLCRIDELIATDER